MSSPRRYLPSGGVYSISRVAVGPSIFYTLSQMKLHNLAEPTLTAMSRDCIGFQLSNLKIIPRTPIAEPSVIACFNSDDIHQKTADSSTILSMWEVLDRPRSLHSSFDQLTSKKGSVQSAETGQVRNLVSFPLSVTLWRDHMALGPFLLQRKVTTWLRAGEYNCNAFTKQRQVLGNMKDEGMCSHKDSLITLLDSIGLVDL